MDFIGYVTRSDFVFFIISVVALLVFSLIKFKRQQTKANSINTSHEADDFSELLQREFGGKHNQAPSREPVLSPAPPGEGLLRNKSKAPVVIQYGPSINSFTELPVTIGSDTTCDFTIEHPSIAGFHAEISYDQGQYWIKDLTDNNQVAIDGTDIGKLSPIHPNSVLSLSPHGPSFRFLSGGRFAEVIESESEETVVMPAAPEPIQTEEPEEKIDLQPKAKASSDYFILTMRVLVSISVLGVALYIIIQGTHSGESHEWAYGAAGTVVGYWLK